MRRPAPVQTACASAWSSRVCKCQSLWPSALRVSRRHAVGSAPAERTRHWPRPTHKRGARGRRVDHAIAAQRRRAGGHPGRRGGLRAPAGGRRHHAVHRAPRGRHLGGRAGAAPGQRLRGSSGCGRVAGVQCLSPTQPPFFCSTMSGVPAPGSVNRARCARGRARQLHRM